MTVVFDNRSNKILNKKLEQSPTISSGTWTPLNRPLRTLLRLAIASRLAVFSLALASHRYISDYDASVDTVLNPTAATTTTTTTILDNDGNGSVKLLEPWLRPFASIYLRWDAFYFLHIAEEGYLFEQEHAFFPLLPFLMRLVAATVLSPLHHVLSHRMVLLISGIAISNIAFILAACSLYRLTLAIFNDRRYAFLSGALFCLTPSAMFMSSIYTESTFALLSFTGMELFAHGQLWSAAIVWCLSSLARSNGIVHAGFFVYELLIRQTKLVGTRNLFIRCIRAFLLSAIVIGGMASFQWYGYQQYCQGDNIRPWCHERIPLLYSFVQMEYWNCGFLRYFELKQLPNFALALPMLVLSAAGIAAYAMHDPIRIASLGVYTSNDKSLNEQEKKDAHSSDDATIRSSQTTTTRQRITTSRESSSTSLPLQPTVMEASVVDGMLPESMANHLARSNLYFSSKALPFIYLWVILLLYGFTSMHVQVITRFFSSMPTVFWYAAHICLELGSPSLHHTTPSSTSSLTAPDTANNGAALNEHHVMYHHWQKSTFLSRALLMYFVGYGLCGVVLFSNFFPPA
ncbi:GPI mannosyltransferase 2 [Syncephalis plumigaleata]|nr:GPI mannosyltransferase 2 [Syncephalis plumigaleata]